MCKSIVGTLTFVLYLCVAAISAKDGTTFTFNLDEDIYVFHVTLVSWTKARDLCSNDGGQLWSPVVVAEQRSVQKMINLYYRSWWMWTGINDLDDTGAYHSLDGATINTTLYKWDINQPLRDDSRFRCVGMSSSAQIGVYSCDSIYYYTCKFSRI